MESYFYANLELELCYENGPGHIGSVFQSSSFGNKQNLIFIDFRDLGTK